MYATLPQTAPATAQAMPATFHAESRSYRANEPMNAVKTGTAGCMIAAFCGVMNDKAQMNREGASLYSTTAKPVANDAAQIAPGTLEGANFNIVHGVVDLVRISRNYEALHKMIESYKDIDSAAAKMASGG